MPSGQSCWQHAGHGVGDPQDCRAKFAYTGEARRCACNCALMTPAIPPAFFQHQAIPLTKPDLAPALDLASTSTH